MRCIDTVKNIAHDYDYKRHTTRYELPQMTYILGSRCSDGVVLVTDKKLLRQMTGLKTNIVTNYLVT